jgi:predicted ester cyclase
VKIFVGSFFDAFSNMNFTVESIIAEGDIVAARGTISATHTGTFQGVAPTGKEIIVPSLDYVRCNAEGKFAEHWGGGDQISLLTQLGIIPTP